ncbi:hypothetical protein N7512_009966 [Penicillium capsulatum]|nr:hypothetical protein N7512_009966 [Penicillium capsulatum]
MAVSSGIRFVAPGALRERNAPSSPPPPPPSLRVHPNRIPGHGEAALSLQRAWYSDPQSLPFARHIKTHALVSLVQKGLQYHELESSIDKVGLRDTEGNPITFAPADYFFGPEPFEAGALKSRDDAGPHPEAPRDQPTNGHPVELPKESMEVDAETESKPGTPEAVDGDGDVSMGADEMPQEPTLTTGNSVGVQISPAKAADLAPDTALLSTPDPVITTAWRPRDPTLLVAAGESFCSLWRLSSSAPVENKFLDLKGSGAYVSATAWDAIGAKLAVATIRDMKGTVTMYNDQGNVVDLLPDLPRVISSLHWSDDSPQLAIVASDERSSELALWDDNRRPDVYPPPQVIDSHIFDLAWCDRNQVFACGDGAVYQCDVDQNIRLIKTYTSHDRAAEWSFIRCAPSIFGPVAVTACSTNAMIWIPTHDILIENAHQDAITAIDIRPNLPAQRWSSSIIIASYSVDSTVNMWSVDLESKQFKRIHRLRLGSSVPALAGGFSPDGYALSAASKDRVMIWNAERGGEPMATWTAPSPDKVKEEPDQPTNGQNGQATPFADRALSWDPDGKKLAYGFESQMALVNLQR